MKQLMENDGCNDIVTQLYNGELDMDSVTDELVQAFLKAIVETSTKANAFPMITGVISPDDFQSLFKVVRERTSSSPSGLHYTIWKAVAQEDDLASWLSIMMSLPFMYGFVNTRWAKMVDVMIEKKRGNRKIHMLRLLGSLEADFNQSLKLIF